MATEMIGVEDFSETLQARLASFSQAAAQVLTPMPGRVIFIAPGATVAHDDCCNGQVWTRLVSITPSTVGLVRLPNRQMEACSQPFFLATVELGIIRCAATVDNNANAPSAAAITRDGQQSISDLSALLGVIRCSENVDSLIGWTPTGPEGGCHGGFWTFTLLLHNCLSCEEIDEGEEG